MARVGSRDIRDRRKRRPKGWEHTKACPGCGRIIRVQSLADGVTVRFPRHAARGGFGLPIEWCETKTATKASRDHVGVRGD